MRNAFGSRRGADFGFDVEYDPDFAARRISPDQLAVVWSPDGDVVVVSPVSNAGGSVRMDVARFPADTNFEASINLRRMRELNLPQLSSQTHYLTALTDHAERTQVLALDGERLALDDASLLDWLVNAERQMTLGTDNHPVFETPLDDTACGVIRLPNGRISMTEVPRQYINALGTRVRVLAHEHPAASIDLCIETPLRCVARYFLTQTKQGADTRHQGRNSEVTAFLLMDRSGYRFGLWSPKAGLFSENAFLAPAGVKVKSKSTAKSDESDISDYVRKAFDQILLQMSPEKLDQLQLSTYSQVVCVAERGMMATIRPIATQITESTGLEFIALDEPVEEATARGLLLGSYTFGAPTVAGAEIIPPVDLTRDILTLADTEDADRRRQEEARQISRRNRAALAVLAGPVVVAALLLALVASLFASYIFTSFRESRADARTAELKPALDRRKSYEANLKWYQEYIAQVSQLRKQQPVGTNLLYELNADYPFSIDPSFYVSELKLSPTGDLEMKGLARNKDAVASFLKTLEFAGGPESGSRLFSNLAYEVQETAPATADAQAVKLPSVAGSQLSSTGAAPGIVQWRMTGDYTPAAAFAPKPSPSPGAAPAQPAQKPVQPPVVAPK